MKKTLAVITLLAGAVSGYSQGQVYIGDYLKSDFQVTVWSPQMSGPAISGNSSASFSQTATGGTQDVPSGTQNGYTGTPLGGAASGSITPTDYANGNLWSIQLYAGPGSGDAVSALSPVSGTVANFYTDPSTVGYAGLWDSTTGATIDTATTGGASPTAAGNTVAAFNVAVGSPATLAIAAWYNGNGAYTSYNAAEAAGVPYGVSPTGSENLGGNNITPPDLPGPGEVNTLNGGITSFSLSTVPEPSTIALGVMGASAFLLRLRRRS
jgi:hypothetical protein